MERENFSFLYHFNLVVKFCLNKKFFLTSFLLTKNLPILSNRRKLLIHLEFFYSNKPQKLLVLSNAEDDYKILKKRL